MVVMTELLARARVGARSSSDALAAHAANTGATPRLSQRIFVIMATPAGSDVARHAAADAAEDRQQQDADGRPVVAAVVVGPAGQQRAIQSIGRRGDHVDDREVARMQVRQQA
jgi:hypothetical protein